MGHNAFDRARRATLRSCTTAFALTAAALLVPPLLGQFYFGTDLTRLDLGLICAIKERLASGGSLALSPLLGNGGALLARPEAQLFYPPRWLAVVLPPDWDLSFEVVFHLAAAAGTMAFLARTFGVRPFTAAAGGIAFAVSGTVLDLLRHAQYMVGASWLPLVWAGTRLALRHRSDRAGRVAAFVGLLGCLLGAEPQAYAIGIGLVALEIARGAFATRALTHRPLQLGAAAGASFLVGLVAWAPAFAELAPTLRGANLTLDRALAWSLTPPLWLGVVLPGMPHQHVEGASGITNLWQILGGGSQLPPWNQTPYLGAVVLCGAALAFTRRRARTAAIVAAGATVFALGSATPVLPLLMRVMPFLARFRYPAKYWLVASIALIVLAMIAIDGLDRRSARRRRSAGWVLGIAAAVLVVGLGAVVGLAPALDAAADGIEGLKVQIGAPTLAVALRSSVAHALAVVAVALVALTQARLRRWLFGVVVIDLVAAAPFALLIGPSVAPAPDARFDGLAADAVVCVQPALSAALERTTGKLEWDTVKFLVAQQIPVTNACSGLAAGNDYTSLQTAEAEVYETALDDARMPAMRALGCTVFLGKRAPPGVSPRPAASAAGASAVRLYDVDAVPRFFVARNAALTRSRQETIGRALAAPTVETALTIADDPLHRLTPAPLPGGGGLTAIDGTWPVPESAEVTVTGSGGGVVGLRTPYLAGWSASQAGTPLPTVRIAGHLLAAVVADAARGPITFAYAPPHLGAGLAAACLGFAIFAITLSRRFHWRRSWKS